MADIIELEPNAGKRAEARDKRDKQMRLLKLYSKWFADIPGTPSAGRKIWDRSLAIKDLDERLEFLTKFYHSTSRQMRSRWRERPVDVKTFVESPNYLNKPEVLWPLVMDALVELNSGRYYEAVLTGAIGCAKTTIALYATAYQLYLLSCMKDPHKEFGLDPSSEIMFIFQSLNEKAAKSVNYTRFRDMIEQAPYFRKHFPFDKSIESQLNFPNRIVVAPVSGASTAAIGQNVVGGIIDELNFMAFVDNSRLSKDGGSYDQAIENYNAIARRRESRFMQQGMLPGMLCLVSSKRYPGQFTDLKQEEAKTKPGIFVYDKRIWDVNPDKFSDERFSVFIGDATRKPRVLEEGEEVALQDRHLILPVPLEYKSQFYTDIMGALRDIGGVSTQALHPFLMNVEAIASSFGIVKSILTRDKADLVDTAVGFYPGRFYKPGLPRFVHVDLAISKDSAGLAIGHVRGFKQIQRSEDTIEQWPIIVFDALLEIPAPRGGEIQYALIRKLLYKLREAGLNLKWITFDTFQSVDMIQTLRQNGFIAGTQSMDSDNDPYELLKAGIYDGRIIAPAHAVAQKELIQLEFDAKKQKIDHPAKPGASKDVSDAMAGVVYGLTMRRQIWADFNVAANIPATIRAQGQGTKRSITRQEAQANVNAL